MSKQAIIKEMRVLPTIDANTEINRRVNFIKQQLETSGCKSLVLGISGGVDSFSCGRLAQLAVEQLRHQNPKSCYTFYAVRLPYGTQQDEQDAQISLDAIEPDKVLTVNVQQATDAVNQQVCQTLEQVEGAISPEDIDFAKGNVKARVRMTSQYQVAGLVNGLVLGTDHSAENITGFYTKHGDGACDLSRCRPIYCAATSWVGAYLLFFRFGAIPS